MQVTQRAPDIVPRVLDTAANHVEAQKPVAPVQPSVPRLPEPKTQPKPEKTPAAANKAPPASTSESASTQGQELAQPLVSIEPSSLPASSAPSSTSSQHIERAPSASSDPSNNVSIGFSGRITSAPASTREASQQRGGRRGNGAVARQTRSLADQETASDKDVSLRDWGRKDQASQQQPSQQPQQQQQRAWSNRSDGSRRPKGGRGSGNGNLGYINRTATSVYPTAAQLQGYQQQPLFFPTVSQMYYPPTAYGLPVTPTVNAPSLGQIEEAVRRQIEYYFSVENLCKDMFLRKKMDGEGWIPTAVIASFNRVRMLTPDLAIILRALRDSPVVETSADQLSIRARDAWRNWVLPEEERDASVRAPKITVSMVSPSGATAPALLPAPVLRAVSVGGGMDRRGAGFSGRRNAPASQPATPVAASAPERPADAAQGLSASGTSAPSAAAEGAASNARRQGPSGGAAGGPGAAAQANGDKDAESDGALVQSSQDNVFQLDEVRSTDTAQHVTISFIRGRSIKSVSEAGQQEQVLLAGSTCVASSEVCNWWHVLVCLTIVPLLQEHDQAVQPSSQEVGTSSTEAQMSEQELEDLIVVKHSRHDRVAGQQAGPHHASDDQHDAQVSALAQGSANVSGTCCATLRLICTT